MVKFLLYIGDRRKFKRAQIEEAIEAVEGISGSRRGDFIGSIFECTYKSPSGSEAIVRISKTEETVTIDGAEGDVLSFALEMQKRYPEPIRLIDVDYNFDL